jgi:hypothetical protein
MINVVTLHLGTAYVFEATLLTIVAVVALAFLISEFVEPRLRPGTKRILEWLSRSIGRWLPEAVFTRLSTAIEPGTSYTRLG